MLLVPRIIFPSQAVFTQTQPHLQEVSIRKNTRRITKRSFSLNLNKVGVWITLITTMALFVLATLGIRLKLNVQYIV